MDLTIPESRIRYLQELLQSVFPELARDEVMSHAVSWTGLRPMSADGVPVLGPTPIENLYINTGHGHLGWTMACGSGQLLADLITGQGSALNVSEYHLERF